MFELLSQGDTTGIFQLESDGVRSVLKKLKPEHFEDIVAVTSLYRPGPMKKFQLTLQEDMIQAKFNIYIRI